MDMNVLLTEGLKSPTVNGDAKMTTRENQSVLACERHGSTYMIDGVCRAPISVPDGNGGQRKSFCQIRISQPRA